MPIGGESLFSSTANSQNSILQFYKTQYERYVISFKLFWYISGNLRWKINSHIYRSSLGCANKTTKILHDVQKFMFTTKQITEMVDYAKAHIIVTLLKLPLPMKVWWLHNNVKFHLILVQHHQNVTNVLTYANF